MKRAATVARIAAIPIIQREKAAIVGCKADVHSRAQHGGTIRSKDVAGAGARLMG